MVIFQRWHRLDDWKRMANIWKCCISVWMERSTFTA